MSNKAVPAAFAAFLSLGVLAACATSTDEITDIASDPRRGAAEDTVCFGLRLSGFYEISDRALVMRRSLGEAYLVETGFCPNLKSVEGLRIESGDHCLNRGDRLSVFDTPLPQRGSPSDKPDRCLVTSIHRWDETAAPREQD